MLSSQLGCAAGVLPVLGYIGPGAGFAFLGSFFILLAALALVFLSILSFPLRVLWQLIRRRPRRRGAVDRVVILGLDGLDPRRVRRYIDAGRLPHLAKLAAEGLFKPLTSTCPPISPVAWSSFMTGVNPGKHAIFDFLSRDLRTYLPELSSSRVTTRKDRRGRDVAEVALLRKSQPFWKILGDQGVFSTILRVPITFPPEPFHGLCLSAMCTPDLRGSQGSYTVFEGPGVRGQETGVRGQESGARSQGGEQSAVTAGGPRSVVADSAAADEAKLTGGIRVPLQPLNGKKASLPEAARTFTAEFPGPTVGERTRTVSLKLTLDAAEAGATLEVGGEKLRLVRGRHSPWVRLTFKAGLFTRIRGLCRFCLVATEPRVRLYATPIQIDPENPAMPISHPNYFAIYLAKLHGLFATLGLAEDTWARSEGILDDAGFLEQAYDIHGEREKMFLEAVRLTRRGLCCCVFDLSDRIQHMFTRDHDGGAGEAEIQRMYETLDGLVGRTVTALRRNTVLFVMSDHGFGHFRRGVDLNAWLVREGFMTLKPDASGREYLGDVDWSRTQAYAFGLAGIYLNLKGREGQGCVERAGAADLRQRLKERLATLVDPATGRPVIHAVHEGPAVYRGPYVDRGTDLVVGYEDGYRASWDGAVGRVGRDIFTDNTEAWTGDHCIDQSLVPGVILCNRRVETDAPAIVDLAPTVLQLFGIAPPAYMDGRAWKVSQ